MAYDFGIVRTDIKRRLGDAGKEISGTSTPLDHKMIDDAIADAVAVVVNLASSKGVTADAALLAAEPDTHDQLKNLAIYKSLAEVALAHGRMNDVYERWWSKWLVVSSELAQHENHFGTGVPDVSAIATDVDDIDTGGVNELNGWDFETNGGVF